MMDYELKIKQLEEETRHYRVLQALHNERLDAHDREISVVDERLERIARLQEQNASAITEMHIGLRDLEAIVGNLAKTVDEFIRSLGASGRTNGKS